MTGDRLRSQGIRYVLVGGYNVLFTLAAFWLLDSLWGESLGVQAVYWISAALGVINGFIFQRVFVWRSTRAWHRELLKFFVLNTVVSATNSFLLFVTVTLWNLPAFPSQVVITAALVGMSFFISRAWVFGATSTTSTASSSHETQT